MTRNISLRPLRSVRSAFLYGVSAHIIFLGLLICFGNFVCSFIQRLSPQPFLPLEPLPETAIFHSPEVFKLDYAEMERRFKIFLYPDGDPNMYYHTPRSLSGKYTSEGYFFKNIRESRFLTNDPESAHLFFIPISCHKMRGKGLSYENMTRTVQEYVESLMVKYPFWNRTLGADHFFVTCHDIGLKATVGVAHLVKNSIRVACTSGDDDGYIPHKDFPLPQIVQPFSLPAARFDPENRYTSGFWAGSKSELRRELVSAWQNDTELDIQSNYMINVSHLEKFNTAKFCMCPGWSDVHGSRIALSIHHGCVPAIMSGHHDLPFNDILDWSKFSIIIKEDEVQQIKHILERISYDRFKSLHYNTVQVQRHLQWNSPPIKYDAFHMVMYQLWQRRHVTKYRTY
ncbi:PREDICTED: probable glycosyltransferase At5g20260 [Theobroma cacao]|uniref:Probable glycosyltransferase At5g20260 n=1 Tax=Theobroma cacao TaxID=3641 RepID=A0AB32VJN0_THECC|nr:PREDICTED: probable glycosyltransferase At5g20260 [Theobroma cacao]